LNNSNRHQSENAARAFIGNACHFLSAEYLPKIERCLEQLNDDQIWWRANPESNSIGNLVLHLCGNARQWIIAGLAGQTDNRRRDAEFAQTDVIPRNELREILTTTLAEVEAVITALDPETLLEKRMIQGKEVEILHALFHVTEHFSMHTGQIILLTKLMTASDLHFYEFEGDAPSQQWRSERSLRSD